MSSPAQSPVLNRPLADLHRHLDGSLRADTLRELADAASIAVHDIPRFRPGMGLASALACFETTLSVLQQPAQVERVAREICEDAVAENVTRLEIRFAPQLHRGAAPEEIVDAAISGVAGRAKLILCGLYGESPLLLSRLVDIARRRDDVIGIDLAGGPSESHAFALSDYAEPFRQARDADLGRTVHAAEGRCASEIRIAIEQLYAQRIGHGTTLLDDEHVLALLLARDVTVEACPTSNLHTGVIASIDDHPLPRWLERGVRACICPDNTLLSEVDSREEHRRARRIPGMSDALLERAIACGHDAAF